MNITLLFSIFHGTLFFSHFCEDHERHCVALAGSLLMIRMLQMVATDAATVRRLVNAGTENAKKTIRFLD